MVDLEGLVEAAGVKVGHLAVLGVRHIRGQEPAEPADLAGALRSDIAWLPPQERRDCRSSSSTQSACREPRPRGGRWRGLPAFFGGELGASGYGGTGGVHASMSQELSHFFREVIQFTRMLRRVECRILINRCRFSGSGKIEVSGPPSHSGIPKAPQELPSPSPGFSQYAEPCRCKGREEAQICKSSCPDTACWLGRIANLRIDAPGHSQKKNWRATCRMSEGLFFSKRNKAPRCSMAPACGPVYAIHVAKVLSW